MATSSSHQVTDSFTNLVDDGTPEELLNLIMDEQNDFFCTGWTYLGDSRKLKKALFISMHRNKYAWIALSLITKSEAYKRWWKKHCIANQINHKEPGIPDTLAWMNGERVIGGPVESNKKYAKPKKRLSSDIELSEEEHISKKKKQDTPMNIADEKFATVNGALKFIHDHKDEFKAVGWIFKNSLKNERIALLVHRNGIKFVWVEVSKLKKIIGIHAWKQMYKRGNYNPNQIGVPPEYQKFERQRILGEPNQTRAPISPHQRQRSLAHADQFEKMAIHPVRNGYELSREEQELMFEHHLDNWVELEATDKYATTIDMSKNNNHWMGVLAEPPKIVKKNKPKNNSHAVAWMKEQWNNVKKKFEDEIDKGYENSSRFGLSFNYWSEQYPILKNIIQRIVNRGSVKAKAANIIRRKKMDQEGDKSNEQTEPEQAELEQAEVISNNLTDQVTKKKKPIDMDIDQDELDVYDGLIIEDYDDESDDYAPPNDKKKKGPKQTRTIPSRQSNVESNFSFFFNYLIASGLVHPIPETIMEMLTKQNVSAYLDAIEDMNQLGYYSPSTKRAKAEPLLTILKILINEEIGITIIDEDYLRDVKKIVNTKYHKWGQDRTSHTNFTHSTSFLDTTGQYASFEEYRDLFKNCKAQMTNILFAWVIRPKKREEILKLNALTYHDCFAMIMMIFSFCNRPEFYYMGQYGWLRAFSMDPKQGTSFTQYIYVFDDEEKVQRTIDESSFGFGEQNYKYVYFYKYIIHPYLKGSASKDSDALFFTRKGLFIQTYQSSSWTKIVKRVSKAMIGKDLNSQIMRFFTNAHFIKNLNLSPEDRETLDKAMNHSRETANRFYRMTGAIDLEQRWGHEIISRFMNTEITKMNKISDEIKELEDEEIQVWNNILEKCPTLKIIIEQHDKNFEMIKKMKQIGIEINQKEEEEEEDDDDQEVFESIVQKVQEEEEEVPVIEITGSPVIFENVEEGDEIFKNEM
jgi:hypothetical protein